MNKDALEAIKTRIENVGMCNDALRRIKGASDVGRFRPPAQTP